ncbi:MAG: tetratricopeptide repeat protein [Roseiarcus sp.]
MKPRSLAGPSRLADARARPAPPTEAGPQADGERGAPAGTTAETLYAQGVLMWRAGRRQEAVGLVDAALRAKPDFPEALCMGGYILGESGKRAAALQFYRRALGLKLDLPIAWSNAGKLYLELGRTAEALDGFQAALALKPGDADLWNSRAGALRKLGRLEESAASALEALRLRPDFAEAALNLGNARLKLDRAAEALEAYRLASSIKPDYSTALCGQALALRALGRLEAARVAFEQAERLGNVEAVSGKGCLDLTLGDFERGWEGYEARWIAGKSLDEALGVRFPKWPGPGRVGERVLAMNDHGFGDTIQFVRYLPMMKSAGAIPTLLAPARLHRLLSSLGDVRIVADPPEGESFDAQIAISSLPRAFATRLDSVPAAVPYLRAEPALAQKWAARIGCSGFKIGIVWQGNPDPEADIGRSMPLAAFAPLAATPNARLISLQKGLGVEQLADPPPGMRVESLGEDFDAGPDAFVDAAAAMMHLDLVVSCDTSIAHLAGALGRPVWVALKSDAEWRWLRDRDDSPWYPTMRLFRQKRRGDWSGVFAAMAERLASPAPDRGPERLLAIPGSVGELIDRIAMLEITSRRSRDDQASHDARGELAALEDSLRRSGLDHPGLGALRKGLAAVDERLLTVEDEIRSCERADECGERLVALARSLVTANDRRAAIKRDIDRLFHSPSPAEKRCA